ncbi:MAG: hypothetical protein MZW92_54595 [Comamonadaceae bacterium]|nr:hypothetical protein [Comamonadaceae bacterium]
MLDALEPAGRAAFERALTAAARTPARRSSKSTLPPLADIAQTATPRGGFAAAESWAWHRAARWPTRGDRLRPARGCCASARGDGDRARPTTSTCCGARSDWIARMRGGAGRLRRAAVARRCRSSRRRSPPLIASDEAFFAANALLLRNPSLVNFLDGCALSLPCQQRGELPVRPDGLGHRRWPTTACSAHRWPSKRAAGAGVGRDCMRVAVIGAGIVGVTTRARTGRRRPRGHRLRAPRQRRRRNQLRQCRRPGARATSRPGPRRACRARCCASCCRRHAAGAPGRAPAALAGCRGCGAGGAPADRPATAQPQRAMHAPGARQPASALHALTTQLRLDYEQADGLPGAAAQRALNWRRSRAGPEAARRARRRLSNCVDADGAAAASSPALNPAHAHSRRRDPPAAGRASATAGSSRTC